MEVFRKKIESCEYIANSADQRESWLEAKKTRIGSSEICTLFGMNKYESPLKLWAKKTGKVPHDEENDYMWLGREMESVIGKMFGRKSGYTVTPAGVAIINSKYPDAIASPDFWILGNDSEGILECKNTNFRAAPFWSDTSPPRAAHMQIVYQMGIAELGWGHVAGLVGGDANSFFTPRVEFEASIFDQMYEMATKFMDMVRKDIPPNASASDLKLLNQLTPRTSEIVSLPEHSLEWLLEMEE